MSDETTVLLVKGAPLADGLEALLETKGVFIEEAAPSHLEASLTAVAPDLILIIGVEPLDAVVSTLEAAKSSVPVVVVADRLLHRDLRQKYKAGIGTIIPTDLPQSALAHRISTLSRRASKGEALVQAMSLAPPKAPVDARPKPARSTATLLGVAPDAAAQTKPGPAVSGSSFKTTAAVTKTAAPALTSGPTLGAAEPRASNATKIPASAFAKPAVEAAPKPPLEAGSKASTGQSVGQTKPTFGRKETAPRTVAFGTRDEAASMRAPSLPGGLPAAAPSTKSEAQSAPAAFEDEFPTAAFELPLEMRTKARRDSMPPETVRRADAERDLTRRSDQEALVAQEIEARQRLSSAGDEAPLLPSAEDQRRATEAEARAQNHRRSHATASAVRLVLCDDDLTRADALASELREHGLDVMLLSPEHSQVRWPRLRRFAPHGLLVDERSLSKGGRQIVSAFRRDPFLKYVPLVVVPFQRLYREQDARAHLAPLFPLLAPLGRDELGLLEQLAQKGQVVVDLSQILPSRLVEVLAESETTCVVSTSGAGRRLTWPIAAGRVGKAELIDGVGSQGSTLQAEDALRFLLDQEDAHVEVALRPQIRLTSAEPVGPLLDRVTASIEAPLQHSVAPGKGGDPAQRSQGLASTLLGVAPQALGRAEAGPGMLPTIPAPPATAAGSASVGAPLQPVPLQKRGLAGVQKGRDYVLALWARGRQAAAPLEALLAEKKRVWPAPLYWGVVCAPFVIMLLLLGIWVMAGDPEPEGGTAAADRAARAPAPAPAPAPPPPSAEPRLDRFKVALDQPAPTCESILGQNTSAPGGWEASAYWKAARQALMQGNVDKAHEMMCRAVGKDPASPAAEGLASFYLGRRAVGLADRYVTGILVVDPDRRSALELESDVLSQQGKVDEALSLLLRTARLEPGDAARRGIVSRKFSADAELAMKSGDFPLAERLLRRSVVLSPQNDQATLRLAEVFLRMGLRDAAKLWAEVLLEGPTKHAEAHLLLGDVARLSGDTQAARKHYEQVTPESGLSARAQAQLKTLP